MGSSKFRIRTTLPVVLIMLVAALVGCDHSDSSESENTTAKHGHQSDSATTSATESKTPKYAPGHNPNKSRIGNTRDFVNDKLKQADEDARKRLEGY